MKIFKVIKEKSYFTIPLTGLSDYMVLDSENQKIEDYSDLAAASLKKLHINGKKFSYGTREIFIANYASLKCISRTSIKAGKYHFIEYLYHDDNPIWFSGFFFLSYNETTGKVINGFYERAAHDRNGNFRLHVFYDPHKNNADSIRILEYHLIHDPNALSVTMNQIIENAEKIEKTISQFKIIPNIDIDPPSNVDGVMVVPLECSYSKRFFSRLFLLQNHMVCSQIISEFGLQQFQIPIKADNEELLTLVCGDHYLSDTVVPPDKEIGISAIPRGKEYYEKYSKLFRLIGETERMIQDTEDGILIRSEASLRFRNAKTKVKEWITKNLDLSYREYVDKTSEIVVWKSEFRLFQFVKLFFTDAVYQYRAEWLGEQSLDIFIPSLSSAIEYQGQQHYQASDYFGGESKLLENQERDKQKRVKCKAMDIQLYEWNYKTTVTYKNVVAFINECFPRYKVDEKTIYRHLQSSSPTKTSDFLASNYRCHLLRSEHSDQKKKLPSSVIRQYDFEGNLVGEYPTIMKAAEASQVGYVSIQKCLANGRKRAGEFFWQREEYGVSPKGIENILVYQENNAAHKNTGLSKPVIQIDPQAGEVIAIHNSISAAAKEIGIDKKGIYGVLNHMQKTAGGFYWQYAE